MCLWYLSTTYIFYESMHTCTTPDASITLYYTHNKALHVYDTSSRKDDKDAEQYHIKVPEYQAPNISYQKKPPDVLRSAKLKVRKHRNVPDTLVLTSNLTVDDLLSLSFPLSEAFDLMETSKMFKIPSTEQVCK